MVVPSEHRSRLTSELLEALMCSQDWIRNRYKGTCIKHIISSYITCNLSILNGCQCFLFIDDDNGQEASFWSVLEDIEEGLEVTLYL